LSELDVSVIDSPAGLLAVRKEWQALAERVDGATVFQSWEWASSWYEHFGTGKRLQVLTVRDATGQLVAVAPCSRSSSHGGAIRLLHLLGRGNDLTEYVQVLADPHHAAAATRRLFATWHRMSDQWDLLVLPSIPDDGAFLAQLREQAASHGYLMSQGGHVRMSRSLPDSWSVFHRSLSKSMKDNVNNYVNRLRRNGHREEFAVVEDAADLDGALDVFLDLHRRRADASLGRRHDDRFDTDDRRAFLRTVARRLFARGALWPCFLKVDGEVVAGQLCLAYQRRLYLYYSGFDPAWARHGVMMILTRRCIERAIARGYRELDLLLGHDQEKQRWGATPGLVFNLALASHRMRSRAAFHLYHARNTLDDWLAGRAFVRPDVLGPVAVPCVTQEPT
jgi:CelD/BcsL family acetyltransferase involved in cellulose biosynthesis